MEGVPKGENAMAQHLLSHYFYNLIQGNRVEQ